MIFFFFRGETGLSGYMSVATLLCPRFHCPRPGVRQVGEKDGCTCCLKSHPRSLALGEAHALSQLSDRWQLWSSPLPLHSCRRTSQVPGPQVDGVRYNVCALDAGAARCCGAGFSPWWLFLLRSSASRVQGLQQLWPTGLAALWHVESSRIRDQTHVPCIGRWVPNHWAMRKV